MTIDPGRWRYQQETVGSLYRRRTKLEVPDPHEVFSPYGGRDWKAQEKLHVPVPIPIPLAEQLFVYGQFDGSGDTLKQQQTTLYGKTGVGVKWALIAGSEVQLRYATLFSYAERRRARPSPARGRSHGPPATRRPAGTGIHRVGYPRRGSQRTRTSSSRSCASPTRSGATASWSSAPDTAGSTRRLPAPGSTAPSSSSASSSGIKKTSPQRHKEHEEDRNSILGLLCALCVFCG